MALRLLVVDFYDSHLREAMKWGEEAAMVVGDKDDQGVDGDGGLRPSEDVEVVGSHGGFQGGRIRTKEILLLVDNGVVFKEEDQKKTHTLAFAIALPWRRHPSLSFYP